MTRGVGPPQRGQCGVSVGTSVYSVGAHTRVCESVRGLGVTGVCREWGRYRLMGGEDNQ